LGKKGDFLNAKHALLTGDPSEKSPKVERNCSQVKKNKNHGVTEKNACNYRLFLLF